MSRICETCHERVCDCGLSDAAKIEAFRAIPGNEKAGPRAVERGTGVDKGNVCRYDAAKNVVNTTNDAEPQGYEPQPLVKTERVLAAWAIWKQMDQLERQQLINMVVKFMEGRPVI